MDAEKRDYYEVLGVSREADDQQIKTAYRKLSHQFHPDKNQGNKDSEEKFKEVSEAYQVLSDPEKRARYDRFGHGGPSGSPFDGFGFGGSANINDIFGDLFGEMFGGGRRHQQARSRGSDLRYHLELSFEEAALGTTAKIRFPRPKRCAACKGTGAKPGTGPRVCTTCGGTGEVHLTQGFFSISRTCHQCGGAGRLIVDKCPTCNGGGTQQEEVTVEVKVPAGADTGIRLKITGEGEPSPNQGGAPGDLYAVIQVRDHPIFKREGTEVLCEVPISFTQAALGATIEVPTLEGKASLKIPPGTQSGKVFRLRGRGVASLSGGGRGDQHVQVVVETPIHLTREQRDLLEKFDSLSGEDTQPQGKTFWEKAAQFLSANKKQ